MADSINLALLQALQGNQQQDYKSSPWMGAGQAIQGANLYDPNKGAADNLLVAALQGALGGGLQGFGKQSIDNQYSDLNSRLATQLESPNALLNVQSDEDLKKYAPFVQALTADRRQQLQDQQTQQAFDTQKMDRNFGQDITKATIANSMNLDASKSLEQAKYDIARPKVDADRAESLRKEFDSTVEAKTFPIIESSYRGMLAAQQRAKANPKDPAAGIEMVFRLMKTLDPSSTVREGEQATATNAGGVPAYIWGAYNSLRGGNMLSPEMIDNFVQVGQRAYDTSAEAFNKRAMPFAAEAQRLGVDPNRAVFGGLRPTSDIVRKSAGPQTPSGPPPGAQPTGRMVKGKPVFQTADGKFVVAE